LHRRSGDHFRIGAIVQPVDFTRLRDVPILAELAGKVAASGAERQHWGAGKEVVQRLLLDRIDTEAGGAAIGCEHHDVVGTGSYKAQAPLALVQLAKARTNVTLNASVVEPVPVACREMRTHRSVFHD